MRPRRSKFVCQIDKLIDYVVELLRNVVFFVLIARNLIARLTDVKYDLQYEKVRLLPYNACHSNPDDALLIPDS